MSLLRENATPRTALAAHYAAMHNAVDKAVRSLEELFKEKEKDQRPDMSFAEWIMSPAMLLDREGYAAILQALCMVDLEFNWEYVGDASFQARLADRTEDSLGRHWKAFDDAHTRMGSVSGMQRDKSVDAALSDVQDAWGKLGNVALNVKGLAVGVTSARSSTATSANIGRIGRGRKRGKRAAVPLPSLKETKEADESVSSTMPTGKGSVNTEDIKSVLDISNSSRANQSELKTKIYKLITQSQAGRLATPSARNPVKGRSRNGARKF